MQSTIWGFKSQRIIILIFIMPEINAFRMDGLGNDFIIIDRRKNEIKLSKEQIIKTSNRNNVGFDQIIYIEKEINNTFPIIPLPCSEEYFQIIYKSYKNNKFSENLSPIDKNCHCNTCKNYSLAYLHHLLKAEELIVLNYITTHNIYFMNSLMQYIRESIKKDKIFEAEKNWYSD